MASSKSSPGPHDRKPGNPRQRCVHQTRQGKPCRNFAVKGSKLCLLHEEWAAEKAAGLGHSPSGGPDHEPVQGTRAGQARAGITTAVRKEAQLSLTNAVLNAQALRALEKLNPNQPLDQRIHMDPKQILLDAVRSAHYQQQIWEAMLADTPPEDWAMIGVPPIPGSRTSSRGARLEAITKFLAEATKAAARASKLAIDAGIEERLVRLAEEQSNLIADTVRAGVIAAIAALQHQGLISAAAAAQAQEAALQSAAAHLRSLAVGGQDIIDGVAIAVGSLSHQAIGPRRIKSVNPPVNPPAKARTRS